MKEIFDDANSGNPPINETVFDLPKYNIRLDLNLSGEALRERLIEISALADKISLIANHYAYQASISKVKKNRIYYFAHLLLKDREEYVKSNAEGKRIMMENTDVDYYGETTSIVSEDFKIATYEYLASRGKDKLKTLYNNLDLGRSMLSWDKSALGNNI
jgi:hypothetical protein